MKIFAIVLASLFSSAVLAGNLNWYDLELYNRYALNQDIILDNGIAFKAGATFDMLDFVAGGTPMTYFQMHYTDCKNVDQTNEMKVIELKHPNAPSNKIVVELTEGCNLGVYVEARHFFTESIFSE